MARLSTITCDYCTDDVELDDEESTVERGWLEVAKFDTLRGEVRHYDFCSEECLVNQFR